MWKLLQTLVVSYIIFYLFIFTPYEYLFKNRLDENLCVDHIGHNLSKWSDEG